MRIKELVEKSGVPRTTIHFYLRYGLLHPPVKTGRTMAYYDKSHLDRLRKIQSLKRDSRVPIAFLREQIATADDGNGESTNHYDVTRTVTTTREKKQKRQEIMRKAIYVFSQKGYHHTKIADITQALKISTGSFYLYFNNKRDLFIEAIDDIFLNIVGEAAAAIKEEKDFLERLKIRGRVFYKNYAKFSEILHQLRAEMAIAEQWPGEKLKKVYHGLTKPLIREIDAAVKEGIIHEVDPDLLAYALTGSIEIMSLRLSLDDKYSLDDIIDFIVDVFLRPLFQVNNPLIRKSDAGIRIEPN
jgi:AcrR family transcriptional regulator